VTRLTSDFWVQAYLTRLQLANIPAYVVAKGDATAGTILVKQNPLDGSATAYQRITAMDGTRPWDVLATGDEREVDAVLREQRAFDHDLWLIEVEDRDGRHLLDEPGLG